MSFSITYWGQEKNYFKFRCPHAIDQVNCPLGIAACSSSNYGMVVKINSQTDLRRLPYRIDKVEVGRNFTINEPVWNVAILESKPI